MVTVPPELMIILLKKSLVFTCIVCVPDVFSKLWFPLLNEKWPLLFRFPEKMVVILAGPERFAPVLMVTDPPKLSVEVEVVLI